MSLAFVVGRFLTRICGVLTLFTVFFGHVQAADVPVPETFTGTVLGELPADGLSSVSNGVVRIQARGAGLSDRRDQGYFTYTELGNQDFDIQVRVRSLHEPALHSSSYS